ncbi:MAG: ABC transporter ATP-binding protein, partial [Bacteroidales bacterium]|nr:ABC transporter ATP-binding protein [Bacteroidales bacterium]
KPAAPQEKNDRKQVGEKKRLSYKEQRELDQLEADLEKLNAEKAAIESLLSNPNAPYDQIRSASERYEALKQELDEKEFRWLELSM